MNMMIVDDSAIFRERVIKSISDLKNINSITQAANAREAIEIFKKNKPDIILLDIALPGENGITVLDYVKKQKIKTVVIMLTNYASSQFRKICSDLNANYFFDKSKEYDDMLSTLQSLVNQ